MPERRKQTKKEMKKKNNLHEALFWKRLKDKVVQCTLCPNYCVLKDGEFGKCRVRKNVGGKLYSLDYAKPCSLAVDPIEKKPFYHFLPGSKVLSIATAGCNMCCKHCQNWQISQSYVWQVPYTRVEPEQVVDIAIQNNIKTIGYTYTEPTIFYEYMIGIAKIAKRRGIKNVIVSNGYTNKEPLLKMARYIDGVNIDLKFMSDKLYKETSCARLEPILETIKTLHKKGVWLEITNLVIPTLNDKTQDIKKTVNWISDNVGKNVPLHFTAFWPSYKLNHLPPTSEKVLINARKIALQKLNYVYAENISNKETNTTYCPKCGKALIIRNNFTVIKNNIKNGRCPYCNTKIAGVWNR